MKRIIIGLAVLSLAVILNVAAMSVPEAKTDVQLSSGTTGCLGCHNMVHPGIVGDWMTSRHASSTVAGALAKPEIERRISVKTAPEGLSDVAIGCAECHLLNPDDHEDTFDHYGNRVHVVVTPKDCATCHPDELDQYGDNLMSHAYGNLVNNPVYQDLAGTINGTQQYDGEHVTLDKPNLETDRESCLFCHGCEVKVEGMETRTTSMGDADFPILTGWPNQGVGRVNPDGSLGSCTSCHARHSFSIEVARKPYTCSECHKGPDVPGYKVYQVSKHGNLFYSKSNEWNFTNVPWVAGDDFTAPTCAACHVSLVATSDGNIVAQRTHRMNDRSAWRLLGIIYAHPHPISPDTSIIKNKAGLPLATELTGEPAMEYLIDETEQAARTETMKSVCLACHGSDWVDNQFDRLENTIDVSNDMVLASTKIMLSAWEKGAAKGLSDGDSIFNEGIEKLWVEQWLFYANSCRYASAMAGADLGVFENGRWKMSQNVQELYDRLQLKLAAMGE